ncbi:MAG: hypothetical protein MRZ71_03450 [Bacteroidales bacterium]|nr:hypothetical protein [Bacteroidales bacterium]
MTSKEISEILDARERTIRSHITILKEKGLIKRIGGNKFDYWEIDE